MSVRRALAPRAVHLRIVPRPTNLSESREIYRVLQRFGEINTFKYLRYEYQNPADNIALALFRDEAAAQRALDASPLRFALEQALDSTMPDPAQSTLYDALDEEDADHAVPPPPPPPPPTKSGIDEVLRPSRLLDTTLSSSSSPQPPAPNTPPMPFDPPPPRSWTKWFQVTVDRSRVVHADFIERQPYWRDFTPMRSMAQQDLAKSVPHIGLSDVSKRPPNGHRTPNRVLKKLSEYVETRLPTLRGMAENGELERASVRRDGKRKGW